VPVRHGLNRCAYIFYRCAYIFYGCANVCLWGMAWIGVHIYFIYIYIQGWKCSGLRFRVCVWKSWMYVSCAEMCQWVPSGNLPTQRHSTTSLTRSQHDLHAPRDAAVEEPKSCFWNKVFLTIYLQSTWVLCSSIQDYFVEAFSTDLFLVTSVSK